MGHFVYADEVDRIEFGEDWVDIQKQMSYGDQQKLVASYMKIQTQLKRATPDIDLDIEVGNITLLVINIKAWSFKDKSGEVAKINAGSIRMLDSVTATKLAEEINQRNQPPKV